MAAGVDLATLNQPASAAPPAPTAAASAPIVQPPPPAAEGKQGHVVCRVSEIPEGGRKIVQVGSKSIGIFHLRGGRFYALLNICPHQLAPLCAGRVTGTMKMGTKPGEYQWERDGEIVRCPWHAWEFDITTGRSIFNPHKVRTRAYPVSVAPPELSAEAPAPSVPECPAHSDDHLHAGHCDRPPGSSAALGVNAEAVETYPVGVVDSVVMVYV
ncbi:ferredoxin [Verrucomicrobia bacterium LW23]|nr:ferredoxin [Verrucomicrobia bacterium LW23]